MKGKLLFAVMALVIIGALATMAFAPLRLPLQEGEVLTEGQVILVGLLASALLWVLRLIVQAGYQPSKEVVAVALYVVSFGMALLFKQFALPPFPAFADAPTFVGALLAYVGTLLTLASPVAGLAYLIYNLLLKRVLEGVRARLDRSKAPLG